MSFPFRRRLVQPAPITRIRLAEGVYADVRVDPDHDGRVVGVGTANGPLDIAGLREFISRSSM